MRQRHAGSQQDKRICRDCQDLLYEPLRLRGTMGRVGFAASQKHAPGDGERGRPAGRLSGMSLQKDISSLACRGVSFGKPLELPQSEGVERVQIWRYLLLP